LERTCGRANGTAKFIQRKLCRQLSAKFKFREIKALYGIAMLVCTCNQEHVSLAQLNRRALATCRKCKAVPHVVTSRPSSNVTNLCTAFHLPQQPHRLCDVELRTILHKLGVQETTSPCQHVQLDERKGGRGEKSRRMKYGAGVR